jgi:hypothetical protein
VVLVVDQFEETFLRCTEDQDRQVFIRALCAAAGTGGSVLGDEPPALVVLGFGPTCMTAALLTRSSCWPCKMGRSCSARCAPQNYGPRLNVLRMLLA